MKLKRKEYTLTDASWMNVAMLDRLLQSPTAENYEEAYAYHERKEAKNNE